MRILHTSDWHLGMPLKLGTMIADDVLLVVLTYAYATFSRSFAEKKQPLSTGQGLFLFSEINPFRDL